MKSLIAALALIFCSSTVFGQASTPPPGTQGGTPGGTAPMMTPNVWEGVLPPAPWAQMYAKADVTPVNGGYNAVLKNRGLIKHYQTMGWFAIDFVWTPQTGKNVQGVNYSDTLSFFFSAQNPTHREAWSHELKATGYRVTLAANKIYLVWIKDESDDGSIILKIADANFNWQPGRDHKVSIVVNPETQTVSVWANPIGVTPLPNPSEEAVLSHTIQPAGEEAPEGQIVVGTFGFYNREPAAGVSQESQLSGIQVTPLPLP